MSYLTFDTRALAIMRMGIAFIIILDLGIRLSDLEVFYSNMGVVPIPMLLEHVWNPYYISLHIISGLWQVQLVLFLFAFFCACMLFIGYRTTLFTILSWCMMLSLHNRNGLILQGGDDLLRMVLFWAMFIPWGKRYSCDRLLNKENQPPTAIFSVACIAYVLQISYLYTGSALLKGKEWDTEFSALYYVYSLDQISFPITKQLYYHPVILRFLTIMAYYFELLVPLLFFVPYKHGWFRTLGVICIVLFHAMNEITLLIGLFPYIGVVTSLGLLPTGVIDRLEKWLGSRKHIAIHMFLAVSAQVQKFLFWRKPVPTSNVLVGNIQTALLAFLVVYVLDWNYSNLTYAKSKLSDHLRFIGYSLRLDQSWGMFAPNVLKDDGWYVLEGITTANEHVDLSHPNRKVSYQKPKRVVSNFKNDRWRKYLENYMLAQNGFMRGYFCHYQKRIWNERNPSKPLQSLQVIYFSEFSLPNYAYSLPQMNVLWTCE